MAENVTKSDVLDAFNFFKSEVTDVIYASTDTATTTSNGLMSAADKVKLDGVATDTYATKTELNGKLDSDATLDFATKDDLTGYVQKDGNKGLSTNDFTTADKVKLDGVDTDTYATKSDLTGYVEKVSGKGLSTNDFTTAEKNKLTNIADSAQVNVIESVKVNNTALAISNKAINIDLANASVKSATSLNSAKSLKVSLASSNAQSFNGSDNATVIGVGGILPVANGGTGNSLGSAAKLTTARSLKVSLASTSAPTFDGSANVTTIGVGGILPVANGGTGNANGTVSGAAQLNTPRNFITNLNSTVAGSFNGTASVSAGVTGTLPVANGGTGQTDLNNVTVGGAVHDNAGNVITDTYVTKTEFNHKINAVRYGYRIKQSEADPDLRVEYIYDAAGMRPAHMVFDTDTATAGTDSDTSYFDYGDWKSVWFVRDNKPCMLKSDGTVDYYLDPNDYSKKENGDTDTDIANSDYDGNAMAQFPLVWIKRYTEGDYLYEIVSNVQYDEDYHAYAHTDANGIIKDYCYRGIFLAYNSSNKLRSLSNTSIQNGISVSNYVNLATANGNGWYIYYWSQHQLIRTLLTLISKSTDCQSSFGNGYVGAAPGSHINTGSLNSYGQFFGFSSSLKRVKTFHCEDVWGNAFLRTAGLMAINKTTLYLKMTPEGYGYRISDTNGYTSKSYVSGFTKTMFCDQFGMFPALAGGSTSSFYCDLSWENGNGVLVYGGTGSASHDNFMDGIFTIFCFDPPNYTNNPFWASVLTYV